MKWEIMKNNEDQRKLLGKMRKKKKIKETHDIIYQNWIKKREHKSYTVEIRIS